MKMGQGTIETPDYSLYLEYKQAFSVSRELAVNTLVWAEPLARQALGVHAQRDQMDMGEALQYIPVLTTAETNGGWGELMPVWFHPYERPLPIFILDNWAMLALLWKNWLGNVGSEYNIENLLKIFIGGDLLIPFLPKVQGGGSFLRHGTFTILLGLLWLEPESQNAFWQSIETGANSFANTYNLREQNALSDFIGQIEFEAFFIAEGSKIGGDEKIEAFIANEAQYQTYQALFGGLCFSLAALYNWYGPNWEEWVFQKINLDYRLARFGLEAWAKWLNIPYIEPPPDQNLIQLFKADNEV